MRVNIIVFHVQHVSSDPPFSRHQGFNFLKVKPALFRSKGADNKSASMLHFKEIRTFIRITSPRGTVQVALQKVVVLRIKILYPHKKIIFVWCVTFTVGKKLENFGGHIMLSEDDHSYWAPPY